MDSKLNPYLMFPGNAQEAMEFYRDIFGGNLDLMPYSTFPTQDGSPPPPGIMHSALTFDNGDMLMGADEHSERGEGPSNPVQISLSGTNEDELRGFFEKLSAGGSVTVPLDEQMWGDVFGMCDDRFGIRWLINISKVPAQV